MAMIEGSVDLQMLDLALTESIGHAPPFSLFGALPSELCDAIWDAALRQESRDRLVILTTSQERVNVMSFPDLVSPLLSVTIASRARARRFYSCRMCVYRLPAIDTRPRTSPFSITQPDWLEEDLNAEFDVLLQAATYTGVLYLSLEHDIFVRCTASDGIAQDNMPRQYDVFWRRPYTLDKWQTWTNGRLAKYDFRHRHIAVEGDHDDFTRVRRVLSLNQPNLTMRQWTEPYWGQAETSQTPSNADDQEYRGKFDDLFRFWNWEELMIRQYMTDEELMAFFYYRKFHPERLFDMFYLQDIVIRRERKEVTELQRAKHAAEATSRIDKRLFAGLQRSAGQGYYVFPDFQPEKCDIWSVEGTMQLWRPGRYIPRRSAISIPVVSLRDLTAIFTRVLGKPHHYVRWNRVYGPGARTLMLIPERPSIRIYRTDATRGSFKWGM